MTDQPQLDQHLDALGAQLDGAVQRAERRRGRLRNGLAATAVVVAVGLGALVALPGGERLDPVDRARAALAEDGGILHWVSQSEFVGPTETEQGLDRTKAALGIQFWTATTGDDRWRMATPDPSGVRRCGVSIFQTGERRDRQVVPLVAPNETAYGPTTSTTYSPWSRAAIVQTLSKKLQDRWTGPPMMSPTLDARDPRDLVRTIRVALERGQLVDRGVVQRNGRTVRKLVGTRPQQQLTQPRSETAIKVANPDQLTYFVDADTFAPVELRVRHYGVWSRAGGYKHWKWVTNIDHFLQFERLPDTPANRELLQIDLPAGTEIIRLGEDRLPTARAKLAQRFKLPPPEKTRAAVKRCEAALAALPKAP